MKVSEALAAWRRDSGQIEAPSGRPPPWLRLFWVKLGPISVPVPHPGQLHWHDLHHLVLGYRTDLVGEMEISAFELRTGPRTPMVWFLCVAGVLTGLLWAPRRIVAAWRRGAGQRNLYGSGLDYRKVLGWTMDELVAWMEAGSVSRADR